VTGLPPPDYPAILSAAAHDLRSPLSTVYGFARTIERLGGLEEPQAGFLAHILDAARDLDRLLDHVSILGRIGDGRFAPLAEPIATGALADAVAATGAAARGADGEAPATVLVADEDAIDAIALLASAAVRLDPARGALTVAADGPAVAIEPVAAEVAPFLAGGPGARDLALTTALQVLRALGATLVLDDERRALVAFPVA
jgi:signal transduction histidine kinase